MTSPPSTASSLPPRGDVGLTVLRQAPEVVAAAAVSETTLRFDLSGPLPEGDYEIAVGPGLRDVKGPLDGSGRRHRQRRGRR